MNQLKTITGRCALFGENFSKESPGLFSVSLRYPKCNVSIQLYQKENSDSTAPYLISNFTRDIKLCFSKNTTKKQPKSLHEFFSQKSNQDHLGSSSGPTVSVKHELTDTNIKSSPSTSMKGDSPTFVGNVSPKSSNQVY